MPKKTPALVETYLAKLPEDQRKTVLGLRNAVIGANDAAP